jgi:hypothetical protein
MIQQRAYNTILHSQIMMIKDTNFVVHHKGDQVWLNAKNLKTTHLTYKLQVKWYGLFKITKALSHVAY